MKEKIVKLINSGNREDIILGMHMLGRYNWGTILRFFRENFIENTKGVRYCYKECRMVTYFVYGPHQIYLGATILTINPNWDYNDIPKIIVR